MFPTLSTASPAQAGVQIVDSNLHVRVWVPAFAGNVGVETENKSPYGPSGHFPPRGKIYRPLIFPLWGKYRRSRGRGFYPTRLQPD